MVKAASVRTAGTADIAALAQTLGAAFRQDPLMSWIVPQEGRRASGLPHFFEALARHHYIDLGATDLALHADGSIAGAAMWAPPGQWETSTRTDLRLMPGIVRAFGRRILAGKRWGETTKQHHPTEPHWYGAALGTDPAIRGTGYGYAMLRSRIAVFDAENMPAYLESSNPANVAYYERFGFEVTREIVIPGGPMVFAMWRAAQSA